MTKTTTSRRGFLSILGLAGVATATTAGVVISAAPAPEQSCKHFEHPSEYLAALQAIGWSATALFERAEDGEIIRMGVNERSSSPKEMHRTWLKFHAIQMRCPVQLPFDVHPNQDWWGRVWQHLYDKDLRRDVTTDSVGRVA